MKLVALLGMPLGIMVTVLALLSIRILAQANAASYTSWSRWLMGVGCPVVFVGLVSVAWFGLT
jgi:protein-S-isoprenylcysteine O-methyltransferase Ste14